MSRAQADIDRRRYRRVRWFFAKVCLHLLWWDLLFALPALRWLRPDPLPRWRLLASRYRGLAVELGGVLIKLGQYLSARIDVLPRAVTEELAGLQDEVPPSPFPPVQAQIEDDFGRPLAAVFPFFEPQPLGAASLAQAHEARLPGGEEVVVKVLRPGVEVLVETDLAAIGVAIGWLKWWRFVRQRVDLDWLLAEFTDTTRRELDLRAEGESIERFAALFADDPQIVVPRIYWSATAARTLTEENVGYLKIADRAALDAAGIDRREVAAALYRFYMEQIFVHDFVHADPHPGNLFVRPLPGPDDDPGWRAEPGVPVPAGRQRPFQLVVIDFGMVAEIPPRLRAALRRFLIGVGNRDAAEVIQACVDAGTLLPGADLVQLEEAVDELFDRFWGMSTSRLSAVVRSGAADLWRAFGRLLLDTPIQVQVDFMFAGRALELLSGLTLELDPDFNPWSVGVPFAEQLAREVAGGFEARAADLLRQGEALLSLPAGLEGVVSQAQRGRLTVRAALAPETRRRLAHLGRAADRLHSAVLLAALLIAGALLYPEAPLLGGGLMLVAGAGILVSLLRRWLA